MNLTEQRKYADENGMEVALMECDDDGTPMEFHIPRRNEQGITSWKAPCGKSSSLSAPTLVEGAPMSKWCDECLRYAIANTA